MRFHESLAVSIGVYKFLRSYVTPTTGELLKESVNVTWRMSRVFSTKFRPARFISRINLRDVFVHRTSIRVQPITTVLNI